MDIQALLKQAQEMQEKVQKMQSDFANKIYEGKAGGGMVTIHMTGVGQMRKVIIDKKLLTPKEQETLGDLIVAAYNNAKKQADEESKNNMSGVLGDMSGGFPFKF
jgi:DNA-binding YbaB/EbfC family protein